MIKVRPMEMRDIPSGLQLCRKARWNQVAEDWLLFVESSPEGCFVAEQDGEIVGTVTTINYGREITWIGMVLVDPEKRRRGIGTMLLEQALQSISQEVSVMLDATPEGREVYSRIGFVDVCPISRMVRDAKDLSSANPHDAGFLRFDVASVHDHNLFGADRNFLLQYLQRRMPHLALMNEHGSAYSLARNGFNFTHIGPVVANDAKTAIRFLEYITLSCSEALVIDVPQHSPEWIQYLHSCGFSEQRFFIRMRRGAEYKGNINKQFAICGPEFG